MLRVEVETLERERDEARRAEGDARRELRDRAVKAEERKAVRTTSAGVWERAMAVAAREAAGAVAAQNRAAMAEGKLESRSREAKDIQEEARRVQTER